MSITKINGKYRLDFRPDGRSGKRIVRVFDTRAQANYYQRTFLSGRLQPDKADNRRISQLVNLWFDLHGRSLKSSVDTKNRLLKLAVVLGDPVAKSINPETIATYRKLRLESGITESTLNRELTTLKALFRELNRLSVIDYESPILKIRKLKQKNIELAFLTDDQIEVLRQQCRESSNPSLIYIFTICLLTGARWSEAEGLTLKDLSNSGFHFNDTKNGSNRFVPVSRYYFDYVFFYLECYGRFNSCYSAFRSALKRSGIQLPSGQSAHVLRHTFASHFVQQGGNLIALQKILGHSSLNVTMRYSHLAPDYLQQAVLLNPLCGKNVVSLALDIKKPVDVNI